MIVEPKNYRVIYDRNGRDILIILRIEHFRRFENLDFEPIEKTSVIDKNKSKIIDIYI